MSEYLEMKKLENMPRLPLKGELDITYRCNNNCRHCWIRISPASQEKQDELPLDEIKRVVDEARKMGCQKWYICGGEPMLRPDFAEIFDYVTRKATTYSLGTNGTLITPEIARLMKRKGSKMISIYGATAEVHDHVTRNPGSFDAVMRGFAYLKEAGTGFIVQITPMRDNYHQFDDMVRLAESLGPHWRQGATWFHLSAYDDPEQNREIIRQRLEPHEMITVNAPSVAGIEEAEEKGGCFRATAEDDGMLTNCVVKKCSFHVDPYGQTTFCMYARDPSLRYDFRNGSLRECWEEFIPSLTDKFKGGEEYLKNCGSCDMQTSCYWCPVYAYLEHGRHSAKVEFLCDLTRSEKKYAEEWKKTNRRYYQIAGITIQVEADLPITDDTFKSKFKLFQVEGPGEDNITIRHHFSLPDLEDRDLGEEIYRKPPWVIYKLKDSWIYKGFPPNPDIPIPRIAVFNKDYTKAEIYNRTDEYYLENGRASLTLFGTDQILLAQVLADREGCYLHSCGAILDGKGLVFVGESDAGKSTMAMMLKDDAELLCDDRNIVRKWPDGFRLHGTWSHGDVPIVSPNSAPLRAIMFLEQAKENRLIPIDDVNEIITKRLLGRVIKPLVNADWWGKTLDLLEEMVRQVPCYIVQFDKSGQVVDLLKQL